MCIQVFPFKRSNSIYVLPLLMGSFFLDILMVNLAIIQFINIYWAAILLYNFFNLKIPFYLPRFCLLKK